MLKFVLIAQLVTSCLLNTAAAQTQLLERDGEESDNCPTSLWFTVKNGTCQCSKTMSEAIDCKSDNRSLHVNFGYSMTWNGQHAVLGACPFFPVDPVHSAYYVIDVAIHVQDLNNVSCKQFNRQNVYCKDCLDKYGPAIFSDTVTCADCSKHRNVWFVYFLFQLCLETVLFFIIAAVRPNRSFSLINVLAFFWQMVLYAITTNSQLHVRLLSRTNSKVLNCLLTVYGMWNLDFIRYLMPPMCISAKMKAINTLLFDLIIALYPFILTGLLIMCVQVHNKNNNIFSFILRPLGRIVRREWNPVDSAVSTFTFFLVLGYSKILFTCLKFLSRVSMHYKNGTTVSESVLYYDPSITYLSLKHIPYIIISILTLTTFIAIPPLLLVLYPIKRFRKCLNCSGSQRSESLGKIIAAFQGPYKNGTEGTRDYRQFSALYLMLRVGISCEIIFVTLSSQYSAGLPWAITGLVLIGFGAVYFTVEPFRLSWKNKFDGFILTLLGLLALTINFNDQFVYVIAFVISLKPWMIIGLNSLMRLLRWMKNTLMVKRTTRKLKAKIQRCMKCRKRNNEEEDPLMDDSLSDMPDRIVNPLDYAPPELHSTHGRSSSKNRSMNVPTYGVV